jgi:N-acetylglucosamine-6-sulfatase
MRIRLPQAALLAFLAACDSGAASARNAPQKAAAPSRPNVVVVLLDDADADITETMPRLRTLFYERGVRFSSSIANTPLCGPSRAVLLAGQYAHNTKVYYNNGPEGGYAPWIAGGHDTDNLGPRLRRLGYRTGLFGKYMNDFPSGRPETFVPPGWDDFRGVLSDREAHNYKYTLNENGVLHDYDRKTGYQTDLLGARLDSFIREAEKNDAQPFFALLAVSAPHVPPEPAERHLSAFPDDKAPRKASYDEKDLGDKPKALRDQAEPLTPWWGREIDSTYKLMRQSLLSVEDVAETLFKTLRETGELDNTYVILTSDNGWMRGEHRIPTEKYAPYEESIRVPFVVVGPAVPAGRTVDRVVGTVDLSPTLLELAGAPKNLIEASDGRSIAPLLGSSAAGVSWRDGILIEHFGGGAPFRVRSYSGVRTERDVYIEYVTGEKEYYDLRADPYQMDNKAASLPPTRLAALSAQVTALKSCAGASCRKADSSVAK